MISVFDRVEDTVRKEESADCQHFLLFLQCFQQLYVSGTLELGIVEFNTGFMQNGNMRAIMALYRSTGYNKKSLHAKHYNTWAIASEQKTPEAGSNLVALVLMVSNKISKDFTI